MCNMKNNVFYQNVFFFCRRKTESIFLGKGKNFKNSFYNSKNITIIFNNMVNNAKKKKYKIQQKLSHHYLYSCYTFIYVDLKM